MNGSRTLVARIEVYCPWLPEEDQKKIVPDLNGILRRIMDAAVNMLYPE